MNIPFSILKHPSYIASPSVNFHQTLCKKLFKLQLKKKNSHKHKYFPYNKSDIFTWFFNFDISEKLKVCSIQNKWYTRLLFDLFMAYHFDTDIEFSPIYTEFYYPNCYRELDKNKQEITSTFTQSNSIEQQQYTSFFTLKPSSSKKLLSDNNELFSMKHKEFCDNNKKIKNFLNHIRFISIDDNNDTLTLSIDLLNDKKTFLDIFNICSEDYAFTTPILSYKEDNTNFYNVRPSEWAERKECFTLAQLLVVAFEEIISINYQIYQWSIFEKQHYVFPHDVKIKSILDTNLNLETFLEEELHKSEGNKDKFFDYLINFKQIAQDISLKQHIMDCVSQRNESSKYVYSTLYQREDDKCSDGFDETLKKCETQLRETFQQSIFKFVDMITFIDSKSVNQGENYVYGKVFEHISEMYSKKIWSELISEAEEKEISSSGGNKGKKRKKKKNRKGKNKDKEKERKVIVNEIKRSIEMMIGNAVKKGKCKDCSCEKEHHDNEGNYTKKKKSKPFFLFPVNKNSMNNINNSNNGSVNDSKDNSPVFHSNKGSNSILDTDKETTITNIDDKQNETKLQLSSNKRTTSPLLSIQNNSLEIKDIFSTSSTTSTTSHNLFTTSSKEQFFHYSPQFKQHIIPQSTNLLSSSYTINVNTPIINNYYIIDNNNKTHQYPPQHQPSHLFQPPPYFYFGSFNPLSTLSINEQYTSFFSNLSSQIEQNANQVTSLLSLLKPYKHKYIESISSFIKLTLSHIYEIELVYYGSFATGLSIESSDIDILIKFKPKNNEDSSSIHNDYHQIDKIINLLVIAFNQHKNDLHIIKVKPIYTASVPVLKTQIDISTELKYVNIVSTDYKYDYNKEILTINFDLTFMEINHLMSLSSSTTHDLVVNYIKNQVQLYPEIKPIMFVLKRYMQLQKLNSSFSGGISSFSLFLLLLAYIKSTKPFRPSINCGKTIFEFFECYSNLNFKIYCIDVNEINPFIIMKDLHDSGMLILDPFTKLNVAKSSFRVDEIKSAFTRALHRCVKRIFMNNCDCILNELI